ncbi:transmembrane protein 154 [Enoplosus armatus]|uniref:transmembrane protein 154 n=1 Tax=Enoplosus armatus TaxID=215367 RepID=UPI0039911192
MSASCPGSMRGPRVKIPLLLLLLLLSSLAGTVLCQYEDDGINPEIEPVEEETEAEGDGDTETSEPLPTDPDATSASEPFLTEVKDTVEEDREGSGQTPKAVDYSDTTQDPDFTGPTSTPEGDQSLSLIIILIPVVLVVVIIGMIVCCIFINRRWNKKVKNQELRKEDPYLDGSSTEKVPMPMFEEDVPSVLELEMEELDQWMKKDGDPAEEAKHA